MISRILSQMSPPPVQTHRISSSRPRPALMLQSQPHVIFAQQPSQLCRTAMPGEMTRLLLQLHLSASCPSRLVHAMISRILSQMSPSPVQTHRISSSHPRPALMLQSQPHGIFAQQPTQLCRAAMPGEIFRGNFPLVQSSHSTPSRNRNQHQSGYRRPTTLLNLSPSE